jgi:hypothetical protein
MRYKSRLRNIKSFKIELAETIYYYRAFFITKGYIREIQYFYRLRGLNS